MKFGKLVFSASAIIAATTTPTLAGVEGLWKCKASGNIPIALVTIAGSSYEMQAVKNSLWEPKANDRSSGAGELDIQGTTIKPTSGPLLEIFGAVGSYCDAGQNGCSSEALMLDSTKSIPLGCWRDG